MPMLGCNEDVPCCGYRQEPAGSIWIRCVVKDEEPSGTAGKKLLNCFYHRLNIFRFFWLQIETFGKSSIVICDCCRVFGSQPPNDLVLVLIPIRMLNGELSLANPAKATYCLYLDGVAAVP
ncbi:hypothetical protein ABH15_09400 [Methanoculleus taiwanensis]|uniref:Uncharacterized protein n=1 Tax=Methanoculleus taiwanensis TaxID=1550565 RepID=A0A498H149_9EURY|nr:hypothetical protein ABH15_09400 [Methanoculleus taiwanensis]